MSDRADDLLAQARRLAGANGLFVAGPFHQDRFRKGERIHVTVYVVYRRGAEIKDSSGRVIDRERGARLGRREDPRALLAFVKQLVAPVTA